MARLSSEALKRLPPGLAQAYFSNWAEDIRARNVLIELAAEIYQGPGASRENEAVASLMHAADYLADRIGYEMAPHPKGMIRFVA